MFAQFTNIRKRGWDEDEENSPSGFSEHRSKRRIASLPHRQSPNLARPLSPPFGSNANHPSQPAAPPIITPADSDSEDRHASDEPRSFFSPYSSSPAYTVTQSVPASPFSSQHNENPDVAIYSDDMDMTDLVHLSPRPFHTDPPTSSSGRIPTPIHSSFAPYIRCEKASLHHDADFADDEAVVNRFRRGRRLPSPISEGEMSPSIIVDGMGDMQMDVDTSPLRDTPTKKGHNRSKHSVRNWTGSSYGAEANGGAPIKRSFSMGYRADCEKCRNKVPGHYNHIITY